MDGLETEFQELKAAKDVAYHERNLLVLALTRLFPSQVGRHPDEDKDWEDDWRWIVFVTIPTSEGQFVLRQQVSWHIHDSELHLFDHLPKVEKNPWDGHSTEEKYERLARIVDV